MNFSHSAEEITFSIEGDDAVPVLRANLATSEGNTSSADINLGERIQNIDGAFVFGKLETSEVKRALPC